MELDPSTVERLVEAAAVARRHAWAPYSGFRVGAAVITEDGRTFAGCNVENASYGLSVCAERNAVAAAVAAGATRFRAVAVVTDREPPVTPCGACRQVLLEFGDLPVVVASTGGTRRLVRLSELLPDAFRSSDFTTRG